MKNSRSGFFVKWDIIRTGIIAISGIGIISCFCFIGFKRADARPGSGNQFRSQASISDAYAIQLDPLFASEPYFNSRDILIGWDGDPIEAGYRIKLGLDPQMNDLLAVLNVNGAGPCPLPEEILTGSGRFFYQIEQTDDAGYALGISETQWFAYDPRFVGFRSLVTGDHPLGKTEASILVRDRSGTAHMVISRQNGTTRTSSVHWLSLKPGSSTWVDNGTVNLPEHTFAKSASIGFDHESGILHAGYLAADSMSVPQPVVVCRCDLNSTTPVFEDYMLFDELPAYGRPCLDVDDSGVVHVCWIGPSLPAGIHSPAIYYTNNSGGVWCDIVNLSENQKNGAGVGANLICLENTVHVVWEGGAWRYSPDHGQTWIPPLSGNPDFIAFSGADSDHRFRMGTATRIPGRNEMAAVLIGERREGLDSDLWTRNQNLDEIWVVRFREGSGWSVPGRVISLDDEIAETPDILFDRNVYFIERPDISADGTGRLILAWDETTGYGPDQNTYRREAYVCWTDDNGRFTEPRPLPSIGDLCGMKPILGQARFEPGFDVTWFIGEIPSSDLRPIRTEMPSFTMGMMHATQNTLESIESDGRNPFRTFFVDSAAGTESIPREDPPGVFLPKLHASAFAPTWTAVPTITPRPTATPTPNGAEMVWLYPVADTYISEPEPEMNYGGESLINVVDTGAGSRKWALIRFDLDPIPQEAYILNAQLYLYNQGYSGYEILQIWTAGGEWDETIVTWNNVPAGAAYIIETDTDSQPIDVTGIVQAWVLESVENNGLEIRLSPGSAPGGYWFFSRESIFDAELRINYVNTGLPTSTPTNGLEIKLEISSHIFHPGDLFELDVTASNHYSTLRRAYTYIILDLMGYYWFWPEWTVNPDHETWDIMGNSTRREILLQFEWPADSGAFDMARFWAILQDSNSMEYAWDAAFFSWRE
ncbi:DNRLRE domain-containing protein [bacterium]|nr:DNRLRE domain-containing protein [candidate division CSSED10-310 bacterium]